MYSQSECVSTETAVGRRGPGRSGRACYPCSIASLSVATLCHDNRCFCQLTRRLSLWIAAPPEVYAGCRQDYCTDRLWFQANKEEAGGKLRHNWMRLKRTRTSRITGETGDPVYLGLH